MSGGWLYEWRLVDGWRLVGWLEVGWMAGGWLDEVRLVV